VVDLELDGDWFSLAGVGACQPMSNN